MNYNMICTDIDGTLLDKNRELSTATINSIKELDEIIETILISSRMPSAMYHLQEDLNIKDKPIIGNKIAAALQTLFLPFLLEIGAVTSSIFLFITSTFSVC